MLTRDLSTRDDREESIVSGKGETFSLCPGVNFRKLVSEECGARGFSTGSAMFGPLATLSYHMHSFSEAITILSGEARLVVQGRSYHLSALDCVHLPAGVAHEVSNPSARTVMVAHSAFASADPSREFLDEKYGTRERWAANPKPDDPEHIVRFALADCYELSPGADFRDLFAGRFGSVGICGGYGRFRPGASLPCHWHKYDESITIIEGEAICLVQGKSYHLSDLDTALVPQGRPHRFLNQSQSPMAMVWVYAGSEPERTVVGPGYCDGTLLWPGATQTPPG